MKRFLLILMLLSLLMMMGCLTFDSEHNKLHWKAFVKDLKDMHRIIDKHFFNMDVENPHIY